jgi:PAS domain S-box-containing protein
MVSLVKTLRSLVVALLVGSALALMPGAANAAPPPVAQPIRVGIYTNYPLVFEKAGLPTGFHLELLKAVAQSEGWTLEYQFSGSLKNVLDGLRAGSIDLGLGLIPTLDRRQYLDFTNEKNVLVTGQLFVTPERSDIRSMSDLEGKSIALINQDGIGQNFIETCAQLKIAPQVAQVNSYEELVEAVATRVVDAGLLNALQGQQFAKVYQIQPTPVVLKSREVQFAVAKGRNALVITTLDRYLHTWKATGNSVYQTLEQEYFGEHADKQGEWSKRQILGAVSLCLLLLAFGVVLGNFLAADAANASPRAGRGHIRQVIIFVLAITIAFWLMDSLVAWLLFNADLQLTLLQWTVTKVPAENLYIRAMLFLVCCVFGIYIVRYIGRSEKVLNALILRLRGFEQLADNARDMVYRMALPSGRYEFVSRAATEIFGYTPAEFYSRPLLIKELVHRDWQEPFRLQWEELLTGKTPPAFEYQVVTKKGETRWVNQRTTVYLDEKGAPVAIEGIVTDVTAQRQAAANG